jgi:nitric oxide synthase-interacting protein
LLAVLYPLAERLLVLVSQKKDIKRQKEKLEGMKREAEEERARAKEAARERVLLEFEKGQLGLASTPSVPGTTLGTGSTESQCVQ